MRQPVHRTRIVDGAAAPGLADPGQLERETADRVLIVEHDRLGIVNEDPADATLAVVSLTFAGTRGS